MLNSRPDKRITNGRARPKFGSARWWEYQKKGGVGPGKCNTCGTILLNPMSILEHAGRVCEAKTSTTTLSGEEGGEAQPDLGMCKNCKTRPAVTDYNGHGHYVCQPCDDSLNREFESEYQ